MTMTRKYEVAFTFETDENVSAWGWEEIGQAALGETCSLTSASVRDITPRETDGQVVADGSAETLRETVRRFNAGESLLDPDDRSDDDAQPDVYEWCEGMLDVRRTFDSDGTLHSVSLLVAFGGPNVWYDVDSEGITIRAYWSGMGTAYVECREFAAALVSVFDSWSVAR